jgi:AmiR/NasT family two-component response regulator
MNGRRVAIANEDPAQFDGLVETLRALGHEPVIWDKRAEKPDIALVGRAAPDEDAFALIASISHECPCPVLVLLDASDTAYVREAARAGAFGYVLGRNADDLQSAIEIALERYGEYHGLQDAFARRAVVEQAKGILMAVHGIDGDGAFDLLRTHARNHSRKLVEVAEAVVESQPLLIPSWARPAELPALELER